MSIEIDSEDKDYQKALTLYHKSYPLTAYEHNLLSVGTEDIDLDDYIEVEDSTDLYHRDNCYYCEVNGEWYCCDDDFVLVNMARRHTISANINSLSSNQYFFCDRQDEWFSYTHYDRVFIVDRGEHWESEYASNYAYYCDYDDNWYHDSCNAPDDEDAHCIPEYHSQHRNFVIPDGITLGVELEVWCEDAEDVYSNKPDSIMGERDGSLNSVHGVEFIGQPMNYESYTPTCDWYKLLATINNSGTRSQQRDEYGIHISVGRQSLSVETQAKFVLFINANREFSEFIADRTQNTWAEYNKTDAEVIMSEMRHQCSWGSKYSATNIDNGRIEVRIFRSTTSAQRFQVYLDYVYSSVMYAESNMLLEDMISVTSYLNWLALQDGYSALKEYIGTNASRFTQDDERRKELMKMGFIVELTNETPTI